MKEFTISNYWDFLKLNDFVKQHHKCIPELKQNNEILSQCLTIMHSKNQQRNHNAGKEIYTIAEFLDRVFDTKFYFNYDSDHSCPYEPGEDCNYSLCGPSRSLACDMALAGERVKFLYQDKQQVDASIEKLCKERGICLFGYPAGEDTQFNMGTQEEI